MPAWRAFATPAALPIEAELEQLAIDDVGRAADGGLGASLSARLVVGADGAHSRVRQQARARDAQRVTIISSPSSRPLPRRSRTRSRPGSDSCVSGPLALLPLFDGSSSLVWSLDVPLARELMACEPHEFERRLDAASALVLGATRARQ